MNLPSSWGLPSAIKERFGKRTSGKQRAMFHDGHLLLVLHKMPKPGAREREAVFFWREPAGKWEFSERGGGLGSLKEHVELFAVAEEKLDKQYDRAGDAKDYFRILEAAAPIHRVAKDLHMALQAAREAVKADRDIIELRDEAAEVDRNLELLYVDTKNAIEFQIAQKVEEDARLSGQTARTAHRLNVIAAIFFPATAISSVFGMNLPSGFEVTSPILFWSILLGSVMLGFLIRGWAISGIAGQNKSEPSHRQGR